MSKESNKPKSRKRLGLFSRCCNGVSLFLSAVLLVQLTLAAFVYKQKHFPLPQGSLEQINEQFAEAGMRIQFSRGSLDLTGDLIVHDITISDKLSQEALITAKAAVISIDMLYLLAGKIELRELGISQLECLCPALLSPSGVAEPLLSKGSLALVKEGNLLHIRHASAEIVGVPLAINGVWQLDGKQESSSNISQLRDAYLSAAQTITGLSTYLSQLRNPLLQINLDYHNTRQQVLASLNAKELSQDTPVGMVRAQGLQAKATYAANTGLELALSIDAVTLAESALQAHTPDLQFLALAHALDIRTDPIRQDQLAAFQFPGLRANWGDLAVQGEELGAGVIALEQAGLASFYTDVTLRKNDGWLALTGIVDTLGQQAIAELEIHLDGKSLCALPLIKDSEFPEVFHFNKRPQMTAQLLLDKGYTFNGADFQIITGPLNFRVAPLDGMLVDGFVTLDDVRVEHITLRKDDWKLSGYYYEHFSEGDFRITLDGTIRPTDLSSVIGPWWEELWSNFSFSDLHPPQADLDVIGQWYDSIDRQVYCNFLAKELRFTTLDLEDAQARVRVKDVENIRVFDLSLNRPEGRAGGWLQWYLPSDDPSIHRYFDLETTFAFAEVAPIMNEELAALDAFINFHNPPRLAVRGGISQQAPGKAEVYAISSLSAHSQGPVTIGGALASNAQLEGHWYGNLFATDQLQVNYSDTTAAWLTGGLQVHVDGPRRMDFDLSLEQLPMSKAYEFAAFLHTNSQAQAETPLPKSEDGVSTDAPLPKDQKSNGNSDETNSENFTRDNQTRAVITAQMDTTDKKNPNEGISASATPTADPQNPARLAGVFSGNITGQIDVDTFTNLQAQGNIRIQNAELQNIKTLGGLSGILDKIGLKFTTIRLNHAEGDFTIKDNTISFPGLAISGDKTLIKAVGDYNTESNKLDMRINIYPAEHTSNTPLAFLKTLTKPLGDAFEMMLFGTLDQPRYRLLVDPRNLINKPLDKQRREEAEAEAEAEAQAQAEAEAEAERQTVQESAAQHNDTP